MDKFRCEQCERNFGSEESLQQHNRDKHSAGGPQSKHELRQVKKQEKRSLEEMERRKAARSKLIKRSAYLAVPILAIAAIALFIFSQPPAISSTNPNIPRTPIHWHPVMEIVINDQKQTIPANLGATGTVHHPIHTHDATGTLHYENNNPTFENMRLGYFFERVWRKPFNSTCVLSYCNSENGTVKIFINENENFEFENFIPRDKDQIRIEFS